jgi:hypothetical protein
MFQASQAHHQEVNSDNIKMHGMNVKTIHLDAEFLQVKHFIPILDEPYF